MSLADLMVALVRGYFSKEEGKCNDVDMNYYMTWNEALASALHGVPSTLIFSLLIDRRMKTVFWAGGSSGQLRASMCRDWGRSVV